MKVKICGLTKEKEAEYLNTYGADYAGFVFFEKSKRAVDLSTALPIVNKLDSSITKVAVLVSPTVEEIIPLQEAGFDILQIHKELRREVLEKASAPIWYAINLADEETLKDSLTYLESLSEDLQRKITGIVVDGAGYGEGKTFDWQEFNNRSKEMKLLFENRRFILAGGLNDDNVVQGIEMFTPDVVDVSSGVEYENLEGKDTRKSPERIKNFIGKVREYE